MMMFDVVQKSVHVHDDIEVDGVDGWLLPVGEDVVEVVVLSLVPQDSALLSDVQVQVGYTFDLVWSRLKRCHLIR